MSDDKSERLEKIVMQVRRNAVPSPPTMGSVASDFHKISDSAWKAAIRRVAKRFSLDDVDALVVIAARDRTDGEGYVQASKAIIRENRRRDNLY